MGATMDPLGVDLAQLRALGMVVIAMTLGAAIGFEREFKDRPAGLRTHMLVAGAAALFVALADVVTRRFSTVFGGELTQSDPVRIIEAVVTGVSFLCAGTIFLHRARGQVEGLTTAASILFSSAVGVCVGLSQLVLAIGVTVLVIVVLRGLSALEGWLHRQR